MKRTQLKDSVRNVRRKIVSFLSLILIVLLGVMGGLGTHYMGQELKESTERFYTESNFKDIIMTSSLGVGEAEVSRIRSLPGVADAEGVTLLSAQLKKGSRGTSVTMLTKTERISKAEVVEGSLPKGPDQVALGFNAMHRMNAEIGDQVTLTVTDPLMPDCLKEKTFTVVGQITLPEYLRKSRTAIAMVAPEALDEDVTMESFTRVYVKAQLPEDVAVYSPDYLDEVAKLIPSLRELSESLGITRLDTIKNLALDKIELLNLPVMESLKKALRAMTMDQILAEFVPDTANLVPQLQELVTTLREADTGRITELIEYLPAEFREEIRILLQLPDGDLKQLIPETLGRIADTLEKNIPMVEKVVKGTNWVILDNRSDEGYIDMRSNITSCRNISLAYGGLFAAVSMLVCFSTLTIIINEQKKMIGATKAFGFHSREVFGKYLIFGEGAAVLGAVLGSVLAGVIAALVVDSYLDAYVINTVIRNRPVVLVLVIVLAVVVLIAAACLIACRGVLKSPAASLINGTDRLIKKKGHGKAKAKGEKAGSLYSRLIVRNMVTDLPRVIISIIIIAGSLIIMGVGFSLKYATSDMIERQTNEIHLFDTKISYGNKTDPAAVQELKDKLTAAGYECIDAVSETHIFEASAGQEAVSLLAVPGDDFLRYFAVRDPETKEPLTLPRDGVLIQIRMSEVYKLKPGDTIGLRDNTLGEHTADIRGIFDNYQGRLMITTLEGYQAIFGEEGTPNCLYVRKASADADDSVLKKLPDGMISEKANAFATRFDTFMKLYNAVVIGLTFMSILLSFLILTNLTNIFVSRKKRELIIMRVNGFSVKEDIGYLMRETVVITVLGLIVGVVAGIFVARMVISIMEQPDVQLVREPIVRAWVIATVLELLFAAVIDFMAFRKVKNYRLSEIAES
nr:ABC transporter permease [Lachnospiraceae bacterium]